MILACKFFFKLLFKTIVRELEPQFFVSVVRNMRVPSSKLVYSNHKLDPSPDGLSPNVSIAIATNDFLFPALGHLAQVSQVCIFLIEE